MSSSPEPHRPAPISPSATTDQLGHMSSSLAPPTQRPQRPQRRTSGPAHLGRPPRVSEFDSFLAHIYIRAAFRATAGPHSSNRASPACSTAPPPPSPLTDTALDCAGSGVGWGWREGVGGGVSRDERVRVSISRPNGLIDAGWLMSDGEASQSHAKYLFDDCSKTPFLYNETSQTMVSYDNAESFAEKGKFIYDNKLGGRCLAHPW
ncbi:hypothetical protein DFP72DRAFT_1045361 [Ephemerocybe angulata]|uniref:Uncharacterized protein n=1 Tax=Ephemerocybe angulata TaxID=980116 RepID=A0A8H6HZZ4_9AGAR|nr:hypothetical protein DFP72DRAFT_1045361 [Tulosesus angulatus]